MIPFKTTRRQVQRLKGIVEQMRSSGVDDRFLKRAQRIARFDQGVYDLMVMWSECLDLPHVRNNVLDDISELVVSYERSQRYQNVGWFERRWRDRHLIMVPLDTILLWIAQIGSERPLPFRICWSIEMGTCDVKRNWLYDFSELKLEHCQSKASCDTVDNG